RRDKRRRCLAQWAGVCASPGRAPAFLASARSIRWPGAILCSIPTRPCSNMRFLSVFLPSLSTDRILRGRDPSAVEAPFALWRKIKGGERIVAANAAARRRGIVPGMAVADSRAIVPALALEENDAIADALTLAALADWHRRFTPLAALDPPDGVMLDVT